MIFFTTTLKNAVITRTSRGLERKDATEHRLLPQHEMNMGGGNRHLQRDDREGEGRKGEGSHRKGSVSTGKCLQAP